MSEDSVQLSTQTRRLLIVSVMEIAQCIQKLVIGTHKSTDVII
jgi:hypothetical protein